MKKIVLSAMLLVGGVSFAQVNDSVQTPKVHVEEVEIRDVSMPSSSDSIQKSNPNEATKPVRELRENSNIRRTETHLKQEANNRVEDAIKKEN